jgi:hypothetical protein
MTDEKLPPIPSDHAIHEIWALNRLDLAGMIALAESGDVAAVKTLLKMFAYHVDIGHKSPQALSEYIARKLQQACRLNDANKAFGFIREKKRGKADADRITSKNSANAALAIEWRN